MLPRLIKVFEGARGNFFQKVPSHFFLFYDLAVNFAESAGGVRLVGVNVHSGGELGAHADYDIAEDRRTVCGIDLDGNDLFVLNACRGSLFGSEVDVALCNDHALGDLYLTAGADYLAGSGAGHVPGLADGSGDAERSRVGERDLDLSRFSCRSEDRYVGYRLLGPDEVYSLEAGELTGLGEVFLGSELRALAEEDGEMLFRNVYVSCRRFD